MPTATKITLSPADLAWLRVQTPENLSVTTVVLICGEPMDEACLKSRIEDRLLAEPRFRQRVESPHLSWIRPHWVEHDEFQLADHFVRLDLGRQPHPDTLGNLLSELRSRPLDESVPLWQLHLARLQDGRSALVLRLHACIADCKAALDLALRLIDDESRLHSTSTDLGFEHTIPRHQILVPADKSTSSTRTLCQLIASRSDRNSPLRRRLSGSKTLTWSESIDLYQLEKQAVQCQSSPTDVLLTGVVGALRTAFHSQDMPTEDVHLRAVVPLNLRLENRSTTGTRVALGLLRLPLSGSTPAVRLTEMQHAIERLHLASRQMAVLGPRSRQGLSMTDFEEQSLQLLGKKASVMLSVADGPTEPVYLCGQPLTDLMWWPAEIGDIALGVSIVSYAGRVRFGVSCDHSLDLDPETLTADMISACNSL